MHPSESSHVRLLIAFNPTARTDTAAFSLFGKPLSTPWIDLGNPTDGTTPRFSWKPDLRILQLDFTKAKPTGHTVSLMEAFN